MVFYFFSHRVIRSIPYGHKPRNRLDMFVPPGHWNMEHGLRPVVIYITGGAWTIGYKAWGSLLGRRLSKQGVMVCCLDYRNFPQVIQSPCNETTPIAIRKLFMCSGPCGLVPPFLRQVILLLAFETFLFVLLQAL